MKRILGLLAMLIRENLIAGHLERKPEECLVMDSPDQVAAWHEQGAREGTILPLYHLNALACSKLTRHGGTLVDLGCGSGQYAAYLARCRPDLRIVGFDVSEPMVATGNAALRESGLGDRVELRVGDMTSFADSAPGNIALISSVFSLHHLLGTADVDRCFREIATARRRWGCAFWIFDLARPRHRATAFAYPDVLTPEAPIAFKQDSINSLIAAYALQEISRSIRTNFPTDLVHSQRSKLLPLYQAFWLEAADGQLSDSEPRPVDTEHELYGPAVARYRALARILSGIPR